MNNTQQGDRNSVASHDAAAQYGQNIRMNNTQQGDRNHLQN